jgi:hypothetical protein
MHSPTDTPVHLQELDHRGNDGLDVFLLWAEGARDVRVVVADTRTGDSFELAVAGDRARDAFLHPFAYAAACAIPFTVGGHDRVRA